MSCRFIHSGGSESPDVLTGPIGLEHLGIFAIRMGSGSAVWCNRDVRRPLAIASGNVRRGNTDRCLIVCAGACRQRATVLAAVVNSQGRPIVDVGPDDFVVSEGGEPRDVLDVHVADYPIALVVDDRLQTNVPLDAMRRAAVAPA